METSGAIIKRQWFIQTRPGRVTDYYEYTDRDALGAGTYGSVFKATLKGSNQVRAVKVIPKAKVKNQERFRTEIEIMKFLDHPSIIKLYETFEDEKNVYLIMEVCNGGELFDRIIAKGRFVESYARTVFKQIIRSINFCHANKISHRDLKPENFIFLSKDDESPIKLIDFGLSKFFGDPTAPNVEEAKTTGPAGGVQRRARKSQMQTKAGTPYYIAPEVLTGNYDETCDIWSCGVILYILLCGYPPFYGDTDGQILDSVKKGSYNFEGEEWATVSEGAKDLIRKMLTKADKRPRAEEVLKHPWVTFVDERERATLPQLNFEHLKKFQSHSQLKKATLTFIASQLGEPEISHLRKLFERLDFNGDGVLTFDELKTGISKLNEKTEREIQAVLDGIDTDKNHYINYTEFLAAAIESTIYLKEDKLKQAFSIFDRDNDGKISVRDLQEVLSSKNVSLQG
eukprot:TRINITY_DN395_c0_g1_i1.p1 TRINITY_DN395_c0_g1~~TRINITY_DN395_c0_g1_i1.p1  ORF type:complete len:456 (-),score=148.35 TRINITY_DN395_c0_g1_i1:194-1561(-)